MNSLLKVAQHRSTVPEQRILSQMDLETGTQGTQGRKVTGSELQKRKNPLQAQKGPPELFVKEN